jgi:hypothetical protein
MARAQTANLVRHMRWSRSRLMSRMECRWPGMLIMGFHGEISGKNDNVIVPGEEAERVKIIECLNTTRPDRPDE